MAVPAIDGLVLNLLGTIRTLSHSIDYFSDKGGKCNLRFGPSAKCTAVAAINGFASLHFEENEWMGSDLLLANR